MTTTRRPLSVVESIRTSPDRPGQGAWAVPVAPTGAFALGGEVYRLGMRQMEVVRAAGRGIGAGVCNSPPLRGFAARCAALGDEATRDFLDPQDPGPSYYGGHVIHGGADAVEVSPPADKQQLG